MLQTYLSDGFEVEQRIEGEHKNVLNSRHNVLSCFLTQRQRTENDVHFLLFDLLSVDHPQVLSQSFTIKHRWELELEKESNFPSRCIGLFLYFYLFISSARAL